MKYGRDQNKHMKRPDNDQPDEEVDELTNLAGKNEFFMTRKIRFCSLYLKNNIESFKLGSGQPESVAGSQVELDELDEMSVTDASEKAQLMRKLKEHQEMQKQIQEEMDTQSIATTVPPLPSQVWPW